MAALPIQGILRAFKGELIHTYNKREGSLLNIGHFQELLDRHNVLLLGDSLGDLHMADGGKNLENVLKIGFLNDKVAAFAIKIKLQSWEPVNERTLTK